MLEGNPSNKFNKIIKLTLFYHLGINKISFIININDIIIIFTIEMILVIKHRGRSKININNLFFLQNFIININFIIIN